MSGMSNVNQRRAKHHQKNKKCFSRALKENNCISHILAGPKQDRDAILY